MMCWCHDFPGCLHFVKKLFPLQRLIKTADGSEETASAGAGNSEKATSNLQHIHGRKFSRIDEVLAAYGKRSGTQNVSCEAAPAQPETQDPPTAELRSEPVGATTGCPRPPPVGGCPKAGGSVSGAPPGGGGGALDALKRLRRGHRFGRREQRGPAQHDSASDASAGGREEHAGGPGEVAAAVLRAQSLWRGRVARRRLAAKRRAALLLRQYRQRLVRRALAAWAEVKCCRKRLRARVNHLFLRHGCWAHYYFGSGIDAAAIIGEQGRGGLAKSFHKWRLTTTSILRWMAVASSERQSPRSSNHSDSASTPDSTWSNPSTRHSRQMCNFPTTLWQAKQILQTRSQIEPKRVLRRNSDRYLQHVLKVLEVPSNVLTDSSSSEEEV
mmetsp:Transcript_25268/g.60140  ORF Transcript_25268/g.60140 Transcript_25268/m.60140 type:complete len:384 (-) Transcript_25268:86-1237(-)